MVGLIDGKGDDANTDPRDAEIIAQILRKRILVARHLFRDISNRRAIIKIVTRLFLIRSTSEYAAVLLDSWRMDDSWSADLHYVLNLMVRSLRFSYIFANSYR